ncbi:MAG: hypothetical protein WA063_00660 [Minisyncoccia bacterium]
MSFGMPQENTDNKALHELRDSMKLLTLETIKSGKESAKLSKIMLALTVISVFLAFLQLASIFLQNKR